MFSLAIIQAPLASSFRSRFAQQSCYIRYLTTLRTWEMLRRRKIESFPSSAEQPSQISVIFHSEGFGISIPKKFDIKPSKRETDSDLVRRLASFREKTAEELLAFLETLSPRSYDYRVIEMSLKVLIYVLESKSFPSNGSAMETVRGSDKMQHFRKMLKDNLGIFDANLLLLDLKLLIVQDITCSNPTFQSIIKMLLKEVNTMGLEEIAFFNRMLRNTIRDSQSLLIDTLKQLLVTLVERHVLLLLEQSHTTRDLCNCFAHVVQNKCSGSIVAKVLTNIEAQAVHNKQDALGILWSLLNIGASVNGADGLLELLFELLTQHIDSIDLNQLIVLLNKCAEESIEGRNYFYHAGFLDAGMNRLLKTGNQRIILHSFRILWAMKHVNVELLERGAELILSNPLELVNCDPLFYSILITYADLNYKPRKWEALRYIFLKHPATMKTPSKRGLPLICNFLILGELPTRLMESYPCIDRMRSSDSDYELQRALVFNAVNVLFPDYQGTLSTDLTVKAWSDSKRKHLKKLSYPLKETLHAGLGGESYVVTGLIHGIACCILDISDSVLLKVKNSMQYTVHVRSPDDWDTDRSLLASDIVCYTDGSKAGATSGIGVHIEFRDKDICRKIHSDSVSLGRDATVFKCEVFAILYAAECLLSAKCFDRAISFFSDSIECVDALMGPATTSSLVLECYKKLNELANDNLVDIHCIPGNRGFRGNEEADRLAKAGVKSLEMLQRPSNSILILIRLLPPTAYIQNTKQLRGCYALEKKILETHGCPIFVSYEEFQRLRDPDKFPYLLQKIRESVIVML